MKKILLFLIMTLAVFITSCMDKKCGKNEEKNIIQKQDIIGKRLILTYYSGMIAKVHYVSEKEVHWQTFENEIKTGEDTEEMDYYRLNDYQFFVNWIEKDGTTVSQIIDLKNHTVRVYLTYEDSNTIAGRMAQVLAGKVEVK